MFLLRFYHVSRERISRVWGKGDNRCRIQQQHVALWSLRWNDTWYVRRAVHPKQSKSVYRKQTQCQGKSLEYISVAQRDRRRPDTAKRSTRNEKSLELSKLLLSSHKTSYRELDPNRQKSANFTPRPENLYCVISTSREETMCTSTQNRHVNGSSL